MSRGSDPRTEEGAAREGPALGRGRSARGSWLTAAAVARAVGGEVLQRGGVAGSVTTDSRADCAGRVFVALRGRQHDGHAFLLNAVRRGATGLLVDGQRPEVHALLRQGLDGSASPFVVRVPDTGKALLDLAAEHRRRHRAKIVGITGSCGKTSTKEWLGAVLANAMPTVRSPGSFNNQVGVPLTLFAIEPKTRAAVVEIGTSAPGEIARLCTVARPDVGIVTCVAAAHLEGLGSVDGVAREKASLPMGLPEDGLCILNGDDAACRAMLEVTKAKVQFTSVTRAADWFATDVSFHALGTTFLLQGERPVTLPGLGTHNVYNALAVIAAASHLGVAEEIILQTLASLPSTARRLEPKCVGGVTIFDDTYNMNPQSARAALQALAGLSGPGRRIAVFGEMLELGAESVALHRALGAEVVRTRHDLLVCVGTGAGPIADGALAAGMSKRDVFRVPDVAAALALLRGAVVPGDRVLCKASRRVALDHLVDRLLAELDVTTPAATGQAS
ncbi:MAG TPA: UDP-N-acetylmuramoyl-tripeptide--D-alanyl-D-alanine ligase [Planctomycetota bacterium]|nr:UDP-N-acetylmuramoyl-tripeptide--D-alanyl-D-alanine ligase [Planctomycetota bacterium]